jgi:tetratricopeptide (TPR) repeat protein
MLETGHLVHSKITLLFLLSSFVYTQTHPNEKIDSLLKVGINEIILQKYENAKIIFSQLDELYETEPLGNIYLAATEIAKAVDYEEELDKDYLDSLFTLAKSKTDILLKQDNENIWYNYYNALIYGYKAYYSSILANLVSAFADGVLSLQSFQKCLDINPDFYEAYIALGTYNYWKSAQVKSLLWIPFIADNRKEGIEYLEKILRVFTYNKHLAAYSLIWIYIDFEESEKALELSLKMLEEYKNSRYFMWVLARAYQDIDKNKAIEVYQQLLKSNETIQEHNQFNEIVLKHKIAMLFYEIGKFNDSLKLCNEILDFKFKSDKIRERLNNRIKRAEILKKKIEEILIKK